MKRIVIAFLAWLVSVWPSLAQHGALPSLTASVTSAANVKTSSGSLYAYAIGNANASTCYLQIFNATAANVTLGTTVPVLSIPVPSSSISGTVYLSFPQIYFSNAISIAATTTYGGSTTCSTGMTVNLWYY
jgi:hypothetical protein